MDMLGVDIDYSSMFKGKNKIVDKSTGKVVCERKIVSADTFIKLKSKYSDGYRMPYEIYIFDEIILGVIYSNKVKEELYLRVIKTVKHLHHFMIKKILILREYLQKLIG